MKYTLFTDGSYNPEFNSSAIGGYIADHNNQIIYEFAEKIHNSDLLKYHELLALSFGLKKAHDLKIQNLTCLSDDIFIRKFNSEFELGYSIEENKKTIIKDILELKKQFSTIEFKHIDRKLNRKADKLAERIQIEHFYNNIFFKERHQITTSKLLKIPNLICNEDFYPQNHTLQDVAISHNKIQHIIKKLNFTFNLKISPIDDSNAMASVSFLDKNNNLEFEIVNAKFEIKKVNSYCLDLLLQSFNLITEAHKNTIILNIQVELPTLEKFDMLLRKRFVLPKAKTPLVENFLNSCANFEKIVLVKNLQQNIKKPKKQLK